MASLIESALPHFAPTTHHYQLDDGRHVLICVPDDDPPMPENVLPILSAFTVTETISGPTIVFLCDEDGTVIDADGDPCNGLTALTEYETGTTHQQALDRLET